MSSSNVITKSSCIALIGLLSLEFAACGPTPYKPSSTDYHAGEAHVQQPDINQTPARTFTGIRVAGPDTDLEIAYWNVQLQKSETDTGTAKEVFDLFLSRYDDLKVYQTDAADAALRAFRHWASTNGLSDEFNAYWQQQ